MEVCYRHSDRETGVSCSSCGRPICPECMTATQVGMRCPECSRQRTQVRTMRSLESEPRLTYALIAANVIAFLGVVASGGTLFRGGGPLTVDGALSGSFVADGEWWRLLTSGFLHAGLFHLFLNMFILYVLGSMLEPAIGKVRFALVYFAALLSGSFGALLLSPDALTLGASGAVFGLMGAAVVVMRSRGINPMESGIGMLILLNLGITFLVPGISIGGHVGGLIGGGLAAYVLFELGARARMPAGAANALAAGVGLVAAAASIAVVA
ncbi:MAG: rhomboid family intramembrane serine protease [Thermoleophilaceae bacterium]|jgi:membrane associated rhomboid family serine protease|nr:rhomboid family intramembrane serine protease [Thermoleophilaceae bacterium]